MFRKPKKIQRRVFCADDDDDGDPEPPPPPIISNQIKKEKPTKVTKLLSFADEGRTLQYIFKAGRCCIGFNSVAYMMLYITKP